MPMLQASTWAVGHSYMKKNMILDFHSLNQERWQYLLPPMLTYYGGRTVATPVTTDVVVQYMDE